MGGRASKTARLAALYVSLPAGVPLPPFLASLAHLDTDTRHGAIDGSGQGKNGGPIVRIVRHGWAVQGEGEDLGPVHKLVDCAGAEARCRITAAPNARR